MRLTARPHTALLLLALSGCGGAVTTPATGQGAAVACERFAEQRVAADLEFWPVDRYTVDGADPRWTVHHGFTVPATGEQAAFVCTVVRQGDGWRLVDLATTRTP